MTAAEKKSHPEASRILLGLLVGAVLGVSLNLLFAPAAGEEPSAAYRATLWVADYVANPIGQVFLRLLFMVVVPLVFCSIFTGVANLGSLERLGKIGIQTLVWFVLTTALATVLGLALVNVAKPGAHMDRQVAETIRTEFRGAALEKMEQAQQGTGFSIATFVNIIPRNVLRAAADERETLGVIFFALMFGIAATQLAGERMRTLLNVIESVYDLCVTVLGFAMKLAPFGVAGLIFGVTAKLGFSVLTALIYFVGVALTGLVIHQFVVLGLTGWLLVGILPQDFFSRIRTLMITAFSTSSSNATLPTTIRTTIDEFGVPPELAGFVLPLGATMNMNGTALFEGVAVLFLAQVAGIELSLTQQVIVVFLAVLTAIGAAGVPGGSLPLLAVVLAQVGVPPDMLGLILGVDRLIDMSRTVPNVTSDVLCAVYLAKKSGVPIKGLPSSA